MTLNMIPMVELRTQEQLDMICAPFAEWNKSVDLVCVSTHDSAYTYQLDPPEMYRTLKQRANAAGLQIMGGFEIWSLRIPGDPQNGMIPWDRFWMPQRFRKARRLAQLIAGDTGTQRVFIIFEPDATLNAWYNGTGNPKQTPPIPFDAVAECFAELGPHALIDYYPEYPARTYDPDFGSKCQQLNTIAAKANPLLKWAVGYPGTYFPTKTDPWHQRRESHRKIAPGMVFDRPACGYEANGWLTVPQIAEYVKASPEVVYAYCKQSSWLRVATEFAAEAK